MKHLRNHLGRAATLALILNLTACASSRPQPEPVKAPAKVQIQPQSPPLMATPTATPAAANDEMKINLHPTGANAKKLKPVMKAAEHEKVENPVSAEKSLGWLKNGNRRYVKGYLRNDGQSAKDRERLVSTQHPHAVVLSCSDSRVPPEIVFDQKLGEIFVVRAVGEALDSSAIASIEYAITRLGTHLILVMGHESCGAVKIALSTPEGSDAGSPAMNKLLADLRPHLQSFVGKPLSEGALVEVWANTEGVARDLAERSEIVRDALNRDEVKIQTAVYYLDSGVVEFR